MIYKTVLFDVDGTIVNHFEGITRGYQYALKHFGIFREQEQLRDNIGPPITETFRQIGIPDEKLPEAIAKYREYYVEKGIYDCQIYDGVAEMLSDLKGNNYVLATASSKPIVFIEKIFRHLGILEYFDFISGDELDGSRSAKDALINYALEQLNIADRKETAVMVGDRKYDFIGSQAAGIDCIGVKYGFAAEGELEQYKSVFIAETVKDLHSFLLHGDIRGARLG